MLSFLLLALLSPNDASDPALAPTDEARPAEITPAERLIARARQALEADAEDARAHVALAWAYARRAREIAAPEFYARARQAAASARRLAPKSFEARKVEAWVALGEHRFEEGLRLATELQREVPDDVSVYGMLVDAHVELGQYDAAESAAQWMLDLRPANVPGLTRAAHLRELFGDVEGALELMGMAFRRIHPQETEDRAWVLTQMAHLHFSIGRTAVAGSLASSALELFPEYHYALAELARVRTEEGQHELAAELLERRLAVAPHPENAYALARALERAGRPAEAAPHLAAFRAGALAESDSPDNANLDLVEYWLAGREGDQGATRALELTRRERERRPGLLPRAAHAAALEAAGRHAEALEEIRGALAVGVRDAELFHRAGLIALAAGEAEEGRAWLTEAVALRPQAPFAAAARERLAD